MVVAQKSLSLIQQPAQISMLIYSHFFQIRAIFEECRPLNIRFAKLYNFSKKNSHGRRWSADLYIASIDSRKENN